MAVLALAFAAAGSVASGQADGTEVPSVPYAWKNVQMVGGGFVDGIVFHPTEPGLCYCRTDMGGAYRRNVETKRWEPLLDWLSYDDVNLMGVESIALDPQDPGRLYLACGTYTNPRTPNGAVLISTDRGKTFKRTDVPFKMGANENGRGNGERMAVDPNRGSIIYLGTRNAGLWRSSDFGAHWGLVESFPDITEYPPEDVQGERNIRRWRWGNTGDGIVFVVFDPGSAKTGNRSQTIYAGVSLTGRDNLFVSRDAGKTWEGVAGQPVDYRPTHGVLASDGIMYLTYGTSPGPTRMTDGAVWKYDTGSGEWTDITPDKPDPDNGKAFGYAAVAVDAADPRVVIASSFGRPHSAGGEDIFRSTDGGQTWHGIFGGGGLYDFSLAPYTAFTPIHWLFDLEIDPSDPDHALFTTGYGGYETFDLTAADAGEPTRWGVMSTGIEETVALDMLSPPKGAHLISAIGDYAGFVHWDPDKPAPEGNFSNPRFGNTNGVDCAWQKPSLIVRVGRPTNGNPGRSIGYSTDGGLTWQPADSLPAGGAQLGHIAVSARGESWVWAPDPVYDFRSGGGPKPMPVFRTGDRGRTWSKCTGIPDNTRIVADRVDPETFYGMDLFGGKLYVSTDGGMTFSEKNLDLSGRPPRDRRNRGDSRGGQDRLYVASDKAGDLWIAAFDGLYHRPEGDGSFLAVEGVEEIHGFGFGKAAPDGDRPCLYLVGVVTGQRGVFRSADAGESWVRINDDRHQWGLVLRVSGDPKKYGRVYVGTHGRGIVYGDPVRPDRP